MDRMNKQELLALLSTLKLDKKEFLILSSAALVLRGIYPDAGDLDIAVTNKGFLELKKHYNLKFKDNGWFIIDDRIEGMREENMVNRKYKPDIALGYYVQNINEYYEYLCSSEREKDKARIPLVKKYISEKLR